MKCLKCKKEIKNEGCYCECGVFCNFKCIKAYHIKQGRLETLKDVAKKLNELRGYCQSISKCDSCREIAIAIQKYVYEVAKESK